MSGESGGLSKLGKALIITFALSLAALLCELIYVLWRRRVFRRQTQGGEAGDHPLSDHISPNSNFSYMPSSKELLYLFCIRPHARVEPNSVAPAGNADHRPNAPPEIEAVDIDVFKLESMHGHPRFLYTIKEGEREGIDEKSVSVSVSVSVSMCSSAEFNNVDDCEKSRERVSLEDCLRVAQGSRVPEVVVEMEVDGGGYGGDADLTPFSTPCASPVYFTPSASPVREEEDPPSVDFEQTTASSLSLDV